MKIASAFMSSLAILALVPAGAAQSQSGLEIESVHVVRSLRLSRDPASDFCGAARAGFDGASFEDRYDFKVVQTRPTDGLVIDAVEKTAGALRACFGPSSDAAVTHFFAEGNLGAVKFTGKGDCRQVRNDFPEKGIMLFRCHLELRDLPDGYLGGLLTTNTVVSRQTIGAVSDPPGYTQASIATVRLWKVRTK